MNIEINGQSLDVPLEYQEKLIRQLWDLGMIEYAKLDATWRLAAKPITRKILYDMEAKLTKSHGKELALQVARPAKNADPNTHLLWILTGAIREAIKHATLSVTTEAATNSIASFSLSIKDPRASGRPLATDGNIGERQDDSREDARREIRPPVSNV